MDLKLRLRDKIIITIILAVICSALFGCAESSDPTPAHPGDRYVMVPIGGDETTVEFLQDSYRIYNEEYFHNRLTKTPKIRIVNNMEAMADTVCDFGSCTMRFNPRYSAAPRVASLNLLHEMCHIKVWGQEGVGGNSHDRVWRSCMLSLDMQGAFRELLIDRYQEDMR